jgi:tetratricopeptide (TPR) repeat protein
MTKAVLLPLGLIFLLAAATPSQSQTDSTPTDAAVQEAVLRQANTIVLRQKLVAAKATESHGDLVNAAKLYQDATMLAMQIGSGIDLETAQAIAGLARTRLALARQAESAQDFSEADKQINQVLKVDPKNPDALALKRQNDEMIQASRGHVPDAATVDEIPIVRNQKTDAGTLVQDGKLLYEMGKLEDAEAKLKCGGFLLSQFDPTSAVQPVVGRAYGGHANPDAASRETMGAAAERQHHVS